MANSAEYTRWDGQGYPDGLAGEAIPVTARIFSIVDAYDAMTSDRPYRKTVHPVDALERITLEAGAQFDPLLATAFVGMMAATVMSLPGPGSPPELDQAA